jgi:hypothetical protein
MRAVKIHFVCHLAALRFGHSLLRSDYADVAHFVQAVEKDIHDLSAESTPTKEIIQL